MHHPNSQYLVRPFNRTCAIFGPDFQLNLIRQILSSTNDAIKNFSLNNFSICTIPIPSHFLGSKAEPDNGDRKNGSFDEMLLQNFDSEVGMEFKLGATRE